MRTHGNYMCRKSVGNDPIVQVASNSNRYAYTTMSHSILLVDEMVVQVTLIYIDTRRRR